MDNQGSINKLSGIGKGTSVSDNDKIPRGLRHHIHKTVLRIMPKRKLADSIGARSGKRRGNEAKDKGDPSVGILQAQPHESPIPPGQDPDLIHVSRDVLQQVALALQGFDTVLEADRLESLAKRRLNTLRRRLTYMYERQVEMKNYLINSKISQIQKSEDPESEAAATDTFISFYDEQCTRIEEAVEDIKQQGINLGLAVEKLAGDCDNLRKLASAKLADVLQLETAPTLLKKEDFEFTCPVSSSFLEACDEDIEKFDLAMRGLDANASGKYPSRPTSDCAGYYFELLGARERHDAAVSRLTELEDARDTDDKDLEADIDKLREVVAMTSMALEEAIEGARMAGMPCKSTGSLIQLYSASDVSQDLDDLNEHYEDPAEREMTEEEIEEYIAANRSATEKWLTNAEFHHDPEEQEPSTPSTPDQKNST